MMFPFKPQNCKWILSSPGFPNTGHLNDLWTYMLLSYGPQLTTRVFKLENNSPLLSIQESRHRSLKFTRYRFSGKKPSPRSSKVGCLAEAQIPRRSCRNVGMKSTKRNASSESDLYLNRLHLLSESNEMQNSHDSPKDPSHIPSLIATIKTLS